MDINTTSGMEKSGFINAIYEFLSKWWAWIFYIAIGMAGKFGLDMMKQKKMSFWQLIGSACISCFIGFMAASYCMSYAPKLGPFIVPIATLISDRVILFLFAINYTPILESIFKKKTGEPDDK